MTISNLKALTIHQPWASAIMAGDKAVENRTWRTDYRGPLVIHAGLEIDLAGVLCLERSGYPVDSEVPRGAILGVVELAEMFDVHELRPHPLATGPFSWMLERPRALAEPVPWRGKQGLWPIDPAAVPGLAALLRG